MNAKGKQVRFVAANSWKLGWQPDRNAKAVVAASTQNEKMERKITSTSAPKARDDCRKSERRIRQARRSPPPSPRQVPLPLDPANFKRQRLGTAAMPERS
jgi:hypothetical protein